MVLAKRVAVLLALSSGVALAAKGQPSSARPATNKRLTASEQQLVLPQKISSRLAWAHRRLRPSGLRKMEVLGRDVAPEVAAGKEFGALRDQAALDVRSAFDKLSSAGVEEAAFLVLCMATKDMDDDLRLIMTEIRAMTEAKQKLRDLIKDMNGWISEEMSKHPGSSDVDNNKVAGTDSPSGRRAGMASNPSAAPLRLETGVSPVLHIEYAKAPRIPPLPPRGSKVTVSGLKSLLDDLKAKLDGLNEMSEMTSLRLQMTMVRRSKFISTLSQMMKKLSQTEDILVQNIKS